MKQSMSTFLKSDNGANLISIIIGFGLATLLRRVCKGKGCIIVKSPPLKDLAKYLYRIDGKCYKYNPYAVKCSHTVGATPATSKRSEI